MTAFLMALALAQPLEPVPDPMFTAAAPPVPSLFMFNCEQLDDAWWENELRMLEIIGLINQLEQDIAAIQNQIDASTDPATIAYLEGLKAAKNSEIAALQAEYDDLDAKNDQILAVMDMKGC
jgi:uncharacterized protein YihD (DUF1040 family)